MRKWFTMALTGVLAAGGCTAQTEPFPPLDPKARKANPLPESGDSLADVELFVSTPAFNPGGRHSIALRFTIEPKWHLYWKNPGDSGAPPSFSWTTPEGITIGEPRWPLPERYIYSGEQLDYVYHDSMTLLFPVTVDENAPLGEATIKVKTDFLVCDEVCLFGAGTAELTVPIADMSPAVMLNADIFEQAHEHIPSGEDTPSAGDTPVQSSWRGDRITIRVPDAVSIEVFPPRLGPGANFVDMAERGAAESDRVTFAIDESGNDADDTLVFGVRAEVRGETIRRTVTVQRGMGTVPTP